MVLRGMETLDGEVRGIIIATGRDGKGAEEKEGVQKTRWLTVACPSLAHRMVARERPSATLAENVGQHALTIVDVHCPPSR
jgi:hypothetical protein